MIHMKKPAAKKPSNKVKLWVVETRDKNRCQYCGGFTKDSPHHWGVHNNGTNRKVYPLLVHHPANLVAACIPCHQKHGSGDNIPEYRAKAIELHLSVGGDCYLDIDEQGDFSIITKPLKGA